MQNQSGSEADAVQQNALENGTAVFIWDQATIVQHSGSDALDLLHRLTTKELLSVKERRAQRTVLTSARGRVVDVFIVANVGGGSLILISDSPEPGQTISTIDYYTIIEDAELTDLSQSHLRASLIGPQVYDAVHFAFDQGIDRGEALVTTLGDYPLIIVADESRGVGWIDLVCPVDAFTNLKENLEEHGIVTVDPQNFDFFRIAHGIPGFNSEYGDHSNPIEAGLIDLIDFDKGCYIGQEVIARLDTYDKVKRNLKVIVSDEPIDPGCKLRSDFKPAGIITSCSTLVTEKGTYLSLGLVSKSFLKPGEVLDASGTSATVR